MLPPRHRAELPRGELRAKAQCHDCERIQPDAIPIVRTSGLDARCDLQGKLSDTPAAEALPSGELPETTTEAPAGKTAALVDLTTCRSERKHLTGSLGRLDPSTHHDLCPNFRRASRRGERCSGDW